MSFSPVGNYLDITPVSTSPTDPGGLDEGDYFQLELRPVDDDGADVVLTSLTMKIINQEAVADTKTLPDFTYDTSDPLDPFYHITIDVLPYTTIFEIVTVPKSVSQPYIKARPLKSSQIPTP